MYTTDFSCYGLKQRHANLLGFMMALGIVAAVFYGVIAYAGPKAPPSMKGTENYYLLAVGGFAAICFLIYFLLRFKVNVYGQESSMTVTVYDRSLNVPLEIAYPFRISRQWAHQHTGRRVQMKLLYLTLFDRNDHPVMTFTGALGAAYSAPAGYEYINTLDPEDRKRLILSENQYSSKIRTIDDEIGIHVKYMENRKKKN
ncbi:MAG: hypothetical protein JST26_08800 [Bacteroidetes bacterium]|nr:hypothetical protein [Bacteroidota bacterium]